MELVAEWFFLWILSTIALLYVLTQTIRGRRCKLPPGPKPLPFIGNLLMLGNLPHDSLARLANTYGPLMFLKLGQISTVVVSSPDLAREILQKKDLAFCNRHPPDASRATGWCTKSVVWLPAAQQWKNIRKIFSTLVFMSQRLNDSQVLRHQKVRELIAHVRKRCVVGESVVVGRLTFTTTMNLISSVLLSKDVVVPDSDMRQSFEYLLWSIMEEGGRPNISDSFPLLRMLDLQGRRRRMSCLLGKVDKYFDEVIEQRIQLRMEKVSSNSATTSDVLDSLIQYQIDDDDRKLDRHAMKIMFSDLFLAASDNASSTVEWAMAELLRQPKLMEKARAELVRTFDSKTEVKESDIERLPYLQAVVKETLRLHPPVPFLVPRRVEECVELVGFTIPKGTQVLVNVWAIGRDGGVWPNPELFKPERFMGRDIDFKGRDFELIPFGSGRRICPGLPLAYRMIHLLLASLLRSFDWKLPEGMQPTDLDMTEKLGLTITKAVPLRVVPILETR